MVEYKPRLKKQTEDVEESNSLVLASSRSHLLGHHGWTDVTSHAKGL